MHSLRTRLIGKLVSSLSLGAIAVAASGCIAEIQHGDRTDLDRAVLDQHEAGHLIEGIAPAAAEIQCVRIQRGVRGEVADARVTEGLPDKNEGQQPVASVGRLGPTERVMLVRFDLDSIPKDAVIFRAQVTLERQRGGYARIALHRVSAPWTERTATWRTAGTNYDPSAEAKFESGLAAPAGPASFDVTGLVRGWVGGELPNHGLLVRQPQSHTVIATSEAPEVDARPRLDVCYATPPRLAEAPN